MVINHVSVDPSRPGARSDPILQVRPSQEDQLREGFGMLTKVWVDDFEIYPSSHNHGWKWKKSPIWRQATHLPFGPHFPRNHDYGRKSKSYTPVV